VRFNLHLEFRQKRKEKAKRGKEPVEAKRLLRGWQKFFEHFDNDRKPLPGGLKQLIIFRDCTLQLLNIFLESPGIVQEFMQFKLIPLEGFGNRLFELFSRFHHFSPHIIRHQA
jgi:hypothetical protein